jgi:hypothetical protein
VPRRVSWKLARFRVKRYPRLFPLLFAVVLCLSILTGCVTPLVVDSDGVRIGLYFVESQSPRAEVRYRHVTGLGLGVGGRGFRLGFEETQEVHVQVTPAGVSAVTPLVTVTTGRLAELESSRSLDCIERNRCVQ